VDRAKKSQKVLYYFAIISIKQEINYLLIN